MTAMAILWQTNDSFRRIGALFSEINGICYFTLQILLKFRKRHKNLYTFISNQRHETVTKVNHFSPILLQYDTFRALKHTPSSLNRQLYEFCLSKYIMLRLGI